MKEIKENNILSIFVYDLIFISETAVVSLTVARITILKVKSKMDDTVISVEEAKLILQDDQMTDQDVQETINSLQLLVELMYDGWLAEKKITKILNETKKINNNSTSTA